MLTLCAHFRHRFNNNPQFPNKILYVPWLYVPSFYRWAERVSLYRHEGEFILNVAYDYTLQSVIHWNFQFDSGLQNSVISHGYLILQISSADNQLLKATASTSDVVPVVFTKSKPWLKPIDRMDAWLDGQGFYRKHIARDASSLFRCVSEVVGQFDICLHEQILNVKLKFFLFSPGICNPITSFECKKTLHSLRTIPAGSFQKSKLSILHLIKCGVRQNIYEFSITCS